MTFDLSKATANQTYNLLIGLVAPRPIAWVSTVNVGGGYNLAPFSFFTVVWPRRTVALVAA